MDMAASKIPEEHRSKVSADPEIRRFQRNMETLRKVAGLSAEELGRTIGVSKQTIRNMEAADPAAAISTDNYINLRNAIEDVADQHEGRGDHLLRETIEVLLNDPSEKEDEAEKEARERILFINKAKKGGADGKEISSMMKYFFPILGSAALLAGAGWLKRYLSKKWGF